MRWRIDLEYDGGGFAGWQLQPNVRTVQGVLEQALETILGHPVRVGAAGRTDAGVHALQQVASFVTSVERRPEAIVGGLNANLPRDMVVVSAIRVGEDFDPRRAPHVKCYRYRWLVRDMRSPLRRRAVWQVRWPLDPKRMDRAARCLVGKHDFTSFRAAGCSATHPVRVVESVQVRQHQDEVVLEIQGRAFLRYMVRNIAGTLAEVGRERIEPDDMAAILQAEDRSKAGPTAPSQGLVLAWIRYLEGELADQHEDQR
jgi:tRNA pseudouridine38-40 synthase